MAESLEAFEVVASEAPLFRTVEVASAQLPIRHTVFQHKRPADRLADAPSKIPSLPGHKLNVELTTLPPSLALEGSCNEPRRGPRRPQFTVRVR